MDEELLGTIKMFAGNFAPKGYMLCNGALLSIAQNTALFFTAGNNLRRRRKKHICPSES